MNKLPEPKYVSDFSSILKEVEATLNNGNSIHYICNKYITDRIMIDLTMKGFNVEFLYDSRSKERQEGKFYKVTRRDKN